MSYAHGATATITASQVRSANNVDTNVVYVGTAPVNLVKDAGDVANTVIELDNMQDCYNKIGYSSDWNSFTLCEAARAHFMNSVSNVAPIYVINVLDPSKNVSEQQTTEEVTFKKGVGTIKNDKIILDSVLVADMVKDEDYTVTYDFTNECVEIDLADTAVSEAKTVTFDTVDLSDIDENSIVGSVDSNGDCTGLQSLKYMYRDLGKVPNLLVAPGWSEIPAVRSAMLTMTDNLNGHWNGFVYTDIPLTCKNEEEAITWKDENGYSSDREKTFYPQVKGDDGYYYHASTVAAVLQQIQDNENGGVPFETCSNKDSFIIDQYFGEDNSYKGFDSEGALKLNAKGITTASYEYGKWVIFGGHTSAYDYDASVDARAIFDTNMRMLMYITNSFQADNGALIDQVMDTNMRDSIIAREQEKLDALVSIGALLGEPTIEFVEGTTDDIVNGEFEFNILATVTPQVKVLHANVTYTSDGFSALYGGE